VGKPLQDTIIVTTALYQTAYSCLMEIDVDRKLDAVRQMHSDFAAQQLSLDESDEPKPIGDAGRPHRPELVPPRDVPKRKLGTVQGRAAAIHSFCHIEFNAINLACDAVYRFRGLPREFYLDWIQVAFEEAYHFDLLRTRLRELDADYGDFPAHNGLWELAQKTAHDVLDRMALIPRVMEARGLDVTPFIQQKFRNVGDSETVAILDIILRDEIGHVEAGSRWFRYVCKERGLEAEPTYLQLVREYMKGDIQCPTHRQARLDAGFSESELASLQLMCQ
jgi:uncharacterized ferritin-like protein (DUF455 family)